MIPYDQYHTHSRKRHRMSSALDDTLPMDKRASKLELSAGISMGPDFYDKQKIAKKNFPLK